MVNVAAVGATSLIVVAVVAILSRGRSVEVLYVRWFVHTGPTGIAFTWLGWAILRRWPRHGLGVLFLVAGSVAAVHVATLSFADARFVTGGVGSEAALRFTPRSSPSASPFPTG